MFIFKIRNLFITNLNNLRELGWQLALTIFATDRQVTLKFMKQIEYSQQMKLGYKGF